MKIAEVPPLAKVREVVSAVDEHIVVTNINGVYMREIGGKWHAYLNRPRQHVADESGVVGLPNTMVVFDPSHELAEADILGAFAVKASELSAYVKERAAIADALIEP